MIFFKKFKLCKFKIFRAPISSTTENYYNERKNFKLRSQLSIPNMKNNKINFDFINNSPLGINEFLESYEVGILNVAFSETYGPVSEMSSKSSKKTNGGTNRFLHKNLL